MRIIFAIAVALLLASGCVLPPGAPPDAPVGGGTGGPPSNIGTRSWWLVLDDAELVVSGGDGSLPDVFAEVTVEATSSTSSTQLATLAPQWDEPLLAADEASFESGIQITVWASDASGTWEAGSTVLTPDAPIVEGGEVSVDPFGLVASLHLHFEPVS